MTTSNLNHKNTFVQALSSVDIRVQAQMDPQFCEPTFGTLGSAGTQTVHRDFQGAQLANTWYPAALANSMAEQDLALGTDDIGATFNSDVDDDPDCLSDVVWYYGLDANPPINGIDFVTTVLHEIGHGLGFQSFVNLATGEKFAGLDDTFMRNLENHATGELYPDMTNSERVEASVAGSDLHWVGTNVINSSNGLTSGRYPSGHVEMFAPDPQRPGSSVSHFSTSLFPNELMEPFDTGADHGTGLTVPLFQALGWSVMGGPPPPPTPPPPPPPTVRCDCSDPNAIRGTNRGDNLRGTLGDDIICGFGGDDRLFGRGGNDCIAGGPGDDELFGRSGHDTLLGGSGNDELFGRSGHDTLLGGSGNDELFGRSGHDTLLGGSGNDELFGRSGHDTLLGGSGNDELRGGTGNDLLLGRSGDDEMHGGPGDDELRGGTDDDRLNGSAGNDVCRGGGGNDQLRGCNP
ncbi:hypothetical protein C2W62_03610 [Candidatus Entotheonella serta]|nr:hypothetical protein C2W62_03610 [Candidatus Entotheonella serta]